MKLKVQTVDGNTEMIDLAPGIAEIVDGPPSLRCGTWAVHFFTPDGHYLGRRKPEQLPDVSDATKSEATERPAKIVYSLAEAAEMLSLSRRTLEVAIALGMLKAIHKGRRVTIHAEEIARFKDRDSTAIWPPKINGKTVAHSREYISLKAREMEGFSPDCRGKT
jgi:excisionase family DNA binding protein